MKGNGKGYAPDDDGLRSRFSERGRAGGADPVNERRRPRPIGGVEISRQPAAPEPTAPEFSDEALALEFADRHETRLRFVAPWSRWFVWTGERWEQDDTLSPFDLARAVCRDAAVATATTRKRAGSPRRRPSPPSRRSPGPTGASPRPSTNGTRDPWLLNTPGGVVDLRTGDLAGTAPDDYMTKITAVAPGGACPLWLALPRPRHRRRSRSCKPTCSGSPATRSPARPASTCCPSPTAPAATARASSSAPSPACSATTTRPRRSRPSPRRAATATRPSSPCCAAPASSPRRRPRKAGAGPRPRSRRSPAATGSPPASCGTTSSSSTPQFTLLIAGNHKPGLRSVDEAIRRRFHLIPFTVTIRADGARRDPAREAQGRVARHPRLGDRGLPRLAGGGPRARRASSAPPPPPTSTARTPSAPGSTNAATSTRTPGPPRTELYASWQAWAERAREFVLPRARFFDALETRGFEA